MTFQMAEGINLQRARALGIIGVTSDIKSMLQGLGRIDRIDSPHSKITYTTFDVPGLVLSSDKKGRDRIESIALLSGVGAADLADEYLEFSAGDLICATVTARPVTPLALCVVRVFGTKNGLN